MKVGTKSVLFGAHCFLLHGWFVAAAWWKLYGFPADIRLWAAFFVHDLGYWGKDNMDGPEGETHPLLGATLMTRWFDTYTSSRTDSDLPTLGPWGYFALTHSRYYAKTLGLQPSRLCIADKLAIALVPAWLYLPMVRATGEVREYMAHAPYRAQAGAHVSADELRLLTHGSERDWYAGVQSYCRRWVAEHRDGKADTWTSDPRNRATVDERGVWR